MLKNKWIAFFLSAEAVVVGCLWTVTACHSAQITNSTAGFPAMAAAVAPPVSRPQGSTYNIVGKFRDTYYYVVLETDYSAYAKDTAVRDVDDQVLAMVPKAFKDAMDIEGSGKIADGRIVNFAAVKNKEIRYQFTEHRYGRGVGNCELVPFYSVAMDKNQVALGSTIFIDETLGMKLPDGSLHDGYWRVDDVGGAIKKDRIDIFVGTSHWGRYLDMAKIGNLMPLTIRIVSGPSANSCINETAK